MAHGNTRLCVACGLLGERCCDLGDCRAPLTDTVCVSGRCVPPSPRPSATWAFGQHRIAVRRRQRAERVLSFDEFLEERDQDTIIGTPPPALPPVLQRYAGMGLRSCCCFSADGRNTTCAQNGCVEPPNFSGQCE